MMAVIFLLSAKAGGVGLNLIGASRLVLIDRWAKTYMVLYGLLTPTGSDWNPRYHYNLMSGHDLT